MEEWLALVDLVSAAWQRLLVGTYIAAFLSGFAACLSVLLPGYSKALETIQPIFVRHLTSSFRCGRTERYVLS
jgi:hypothetical protein